MSKYSSSMTKIDKEIIKKASSIELLILDVDGVMTDGGIYLSETGQESKRFFAQDGHGLVILKTLGIKLVIISGRYSKAVEVRAQELGFMEVIQNSRDKLGDFNKKFSDEYSLDKVCFVGDDIVDLDLLKNVGLAITVPNANFKCLSSTTHWTTPRKGGHGAVRDVCDLIYMAKKNNV